MHKVSTNSLADEIIKELENYSDDVAQGLKTEMMSAAKEALKELETTSPEGRRGKYKKAWRVKKMYESKDDLRVAIYNSTEAGLTHLLENGHKVSNQYGATNRRTRAFPHIVPVQEKLNEQLENRIKVVLRRGR